MRVATRALTVKLVALIVLMGIALATSLAIWHARQASLDAHTALVGRADALLDNHRAALERAARSRNIVQLEASVQALSAGQETAYVEVSLRDATSPPFVAGDPAALADAATHHHDGDWVRERVLLDRDGAEPGSQPQVLGVIRLVPDDTALEEAISGHLRASLMRQLAVTVMVHRQPVGPAAPAGQLAAADNDAAHRRAAPGFVVAAARYLAALAGMAPGRLRPAK